MDGESKLAVSVGVGSHEPPASSLMRGTQVGCGKLAKGSLIPVAMKVPRGALDGLSLDVFRKHVAGAALSDDPVLLRPQIDGDLSAVASTGEGLAGERAVENVHDASPGPSVEFTDVWEDGQPGENPVGNPLPQDGLAVLSDLDGADGPVTEQEVCQEPAASSCKKVESSESVQLRGPLTPLRIHQAHARSSGYAIAWSTTSICPARWGQTTK